MKKTYSISLGALAPELSKQLSQFKLNRDKLKMLQEDANAISRLSIRGFISEGVTHSARRKLANKITDLIEKKKSI